LVNRESERRFDPFGVLRDARSLRFLSTLILRRMP